MAHALIHPDLWKQPAPLEAVGLWVCCLSWSVKYRDDVIPDAIINMMDREHGMERAYDLEAYGFWARTDDGWKLNPQWFRHNYRSDVEIERGKMTPAIRRRIIERDGPWCVACGWPHTPDGSTDGSGLHIDHMVPVSRGGKTIDSNLTVLCAPCNIDKGALTFDEWWFPKMAHIEPERGYVWELA